jgi:DNA-binding TFAR19-related protein (PDSD5 family)
MANDELELWKQRKLLEMQRKALLKSMHKENKEKIEKPPETPESIVRRLFEGRAGEVYDAAKSQFPEVTRKITTVLAELISKGELTGPVSGEELLWLFRRAGANVRLETHIRYVESGKAKSIAEKIRSG